MIKTYLLQIFFFTLISAFVHPGLLVSNADINRIQNKIASKQDPWLASWTKLTSIKYASPSYTSNAVPIVYRGNDGVHASNAENLWHDAAAAFNLALRWKVDKDVECAEAASKILIAWGTTMTAFGDSDENYLAAGFQGHQLANAAELLRDYSPFEKNGLSIVIEMLNNVFLSKNIFFLNHQAPSEHNHKHFHANWELGNIASTMAIAILGDNQTAFDYAVEYFKNGSGNGAINNAITNIVSEPGTGFPLGQGQESGRDQGHSALNQQMLGVIAQQAWNQGEDLYAYNNSRILLGAEYFARYNLGNDVPFVPWTNNIVSWTEISSASRGATRPTWELLYSHYAQIKGINAPWTKEYLNHTLETFGGLFEGGAGSYGEGSGHYDGLGWGTLLYRRDQSDVDAIHSSSTSTAVTSTSAVLVSSTTPAGAASSSAFSEFSASSSASLATFQSTSVVDTLTSPTSPVVEPTTLATLTRAATHVAAPDRISTSTSAAMGTKITAAPVEDDDDSCEID
ncbi:chondroitin AC/alginate lyase [Cadophora sp. MPI-SDFR-AT-0126]|nr:chondroitin AC/alginate lyase [Leotiomycetes sp. MPI-SDFR-AT-0126]